MSVMPLASPVMLSNDDSLHNIRQNAKQTLPEVAVDSDKAEDKPKSIGTAHEAMMGRGGMPGSSFTMAPGVSRPMSEPAVKQVNPALMDAIEENGPVASTQGILNNLGNEIRNGGGLEAPAFSLASKATDGAGPRPAEKAKEVANINSAVAETLSGIEVFGSTEFNAREAAASSHDKIQDVLDGVKETMAASSQDDVISTALKALYSGTEASDQATKSVPKATKDPLTGDDVLVTEGKNYVLIQNLDNPDESELFLADDLTPEEVEEVARQVGYDVFSAVAKQYGYTVDEAEYDELFDASLDVFVMIITSEANALDNEEEIEYQIMLRRAIAEKAAEEAQGKDAVAGVSALDDDDTSSSERTRRPRGESERTRRPRGEAGDNSGLMSRAAEFRSMAAEFRAEAKSETGHRAENLNARADRADAAADRMEAAAARSGGGSAPEAVETPEEPATSAPAADDAVMPSAPAVDDDADAVMPDPVMSETKDKKTSEAQGEPMAAPVSNKGGRPVSANGSLKANQMAANGHWAASKLAGKDVMVWNPGGSGEQSNYGDNEAYASQALSYQFSAQKNGKYNIVVEGGRMDSAVNAAEKSHGIRDKGNDVWVQISEVRTDANGNTVMDPVMSPQKLFFRVNDNGNRLLNGSEFERHGQIKKATADLEAGKDYVIQFMGRSDGFAMSEASVVPA